MEKFFLFTRGRTGSSAVIDELNKCIGFCVGQELFLRYEHPKTVRDIKISTEYIPPYAIWKISKPITKILPERISTAHYLNVIERAVSNSGIEIFGFKILSHHFSENVHLSSILKNRGYKAIYLSRNLSRQVLSGMVARKRNLYNTKQEVQDNQQYNIDLEEFKGRLLWAENGVKLDKELLKQKGFDFIEVEYETFVHHRDKFYEPIFQLLNVPDQTPPASDFKIMIKDVKQTVTNYHEVENLSIELGLPLNE